MSRYCVPPVSFRLWLNLAQKSILSKNKSRKQLWDELTEILEFDTNDPAYFVIPRGLFLSLQSFCLVDGKYSNLNDDKLLNVLTTLDQLRVSLNEYDKTRTIVALPPAEEEEQGAQNE